jgi:hypothetical protein
MAGNTKEVTELTIGNTYIGGIYVPVYLPGNLSMWHLLFTQLIGYKHQFGQGSLFKQGYSFLNGQHVKIQGFRVELIQLHKNLLLQQKY